MGNTGVREKSRRQGEKQLWYWRNTWEAHNHRYRLNQKVSLTAPSHLIPKTIFSIVIVDYSWKSCKITTLSEVKEAQTKKKRQKHTKRIWHFCYLYQQQTLNRIQLLISIQFNKKNITVHAIWSGEKNSLKRQSN